jgi:sporulation protein YlmC with PRC-barrel domain
MLKCSGVAKTLITVLVSIAAIVQIAHAQSHEVSAPLRATQLMGLKVEDTDGEKIGTLRNLILDMRTGQIKFAVVRSGGFIGVGSTLKLAPAQIMSAATTKRETLSINATLGRWKEAPGFSRSQLASLADPVESERITSYFVKPTARMNAGSGAQATTSPAVLKFATDVIGKTVVNRQHQKIGDVVDLLASFGRTHTTFAIVSTGRVLSRGQDYAVSATALTPGAGSRLTMDADTATLQKAPPFNQQVWDAGRLENSGIFSYSKSQQ